MKRKLIVMLLGFLTGTTFLGVFPIPEELWLYAMVIILLLVLLFSCVKKKEEFRLLAIFIITALVGVILTILIPRIGEIGEYVVDLLAIILSVITTVVLGITKSENEN